MIILVKSKEIKDEVAYMVMSAHITEKWWCDDDFDEDRELWAH